AIAKAPAFVVFSPARRKPGGVLLLRNFLAAFRPFFLHDLRTRPANHSPHHHDGDHPLRLSGSELTKKPRSIKKPRLATGLPVMEEFSAMSAASAASPASLRPTTGARRPRRR